MTNNTLLTLLTLLTPSHTHTHHGGGDGKNRAGESAKEEGKRADAKECEKTDQ